MSRYTTTKNNQSPMSREAEKRALTEQKQKLEDELELLVRKRARERECVVVDNINVRNCGAQYGLLRSR